MVRRADERPLPISRPSLAQRCCATPRRGRSPAARRPSRVSNGEHRAWSRNRSSQRRRFIFGVAPAAHRGPRPRDAAARKATFGARIASGAPGDAVRPISPEAWTTPRRREFDEAGQRRSARRPRPSSSMARPAAPPSRMTSRPRRTSSVSPQSNCVCTARPPRRQRCGRGDPNGARCGLAAERQPESARLSEIRWRARSSPTRVIRRPPAELAARRMVTRDAARIVGLDATLGLLAANRPATCWCSRAATTIRGRACLLDIGDVELGHDRWRPGVRTDGLVTASRGSRSMAPSRSSAWAGACWSTRASSVRVTVPGARARGVARRAHRALTQVGPIFG